MDFLYLLLYKAVVKLHAWVGIFCEIRMKGKKKPFSTYYNFPDIHPVKP